MKKIELPDRLHAQDTYLFTKGERDENKFTVEKPVEKTDCEAELIVKLPNNKYYNLEGKEVIISKSDEKYLHKASEGAYNLPGSFFDTNGNLHDIRYPQSSDHFYRTMDKIAQINYYLTECKKIEPGSIESDGIWYHRKNNNDYTGDYWISTFHYSNHNSNTLVDVKALGYYDDYYSKQVLLEINEYFKNFSKAFYKKHQKDCINYFYTEKKNLTKQIKSKIDQYKKEKDYGYDVTNIENEIIELKKKYNDLILLGEKIFKKPAKKQLLEINKKNIQSIKTVKTEEKLDESISETLNSLYNDIIQK